MRKLIPFLVVWLAAGILIGGSIVRLSGRHFTVLLTEPEGWKLDTQSASQLAHFVIYPKGTTWRRAEAVIFGRFVPRGEEESAEDFVLDEEGRFQLDCPGLEIRKRKLDMESPYPILVNSFHCHGSRNELVAVVTVPSYFVVLLLGSSREETLEAYRPIFKEVVEGLRWLPRDEPPTIRLPQPPGR